ncbi:MAG: methylated-DNA--[protein]-cysteine S-methyltransferase [Phycisphaerae bacterium]
MPKVKKSAAVYRATWPTAWGPMGGLASRNGISGIILPHYQPDDLEALMAWEYPKALSDEGPFEALIDATRDFFNGKAPDFSEVQIDLPGPETFSGLVYRGCMEIEYGRTLSYSQLAIKINREGSARAVATALSKNPTPIIVPCHRVIYSNGQMGGYSGEGGPDQKQRLLDLEKP